MADGSTPDWKETLRTQQWARLHELRRFVSQLDSATTALINVRGEMIDRDHPAFHCIHLV